MTPEWQALLSGAVGMGLPLVLAVAELRGYAETEVIGTLALARQVPSPNPREMRPLGRCRHACGPTFPRGPMHQPTGRSDNRKWRRTPIYRARFP